MRELSALLIISLLFSNLSFTQPVPDFTVTTTEGVTRSLYADYLDQWKVVVIEFFFTTCPPCNAIAPMVQQANQTWGNGQGQVVFLELSIMSWDSTNDVAAYEDAHGFTFYGAGADGGALAAVQPYLDGDFGEFSGTPTFAVISPIWGIQLVSQQNTPQETITSLNMAITYATMTPDDFGSASLNFQTPEQESITHVAVSDQMGNIAYSNQYGFIQLGYINDTFIVQPYLDTLPVNGVTTWDIVLMTKHILGTYSFPDNCRFAAADVNNSGTVTAYDMYLVRKVLLHIIPTFPDGHSWRFFANYGNYNGCDSIPFAPGEVQIFPNGNPPYDFTGVKYGDVNASATANLVGSEIRYDRQFLSEAAINFDPDNALYSVSFTAKDLQNVSGFQAGLNFDPERFEFEGYEAGAIADLNEECFGLTKLNEGKLLMNWVDAYGRSFADGETLFTLFFKNINNSEEPLVLKADPAVMLPEIYLNDEVYQWNLNFVPAEISGQKFALLRNPVSTEIELAYNHPVNEKTDAYIYDSKGSFLKKLSLNPGNSASGFLNIPVRELSAGIYFLAIRSGETNASFKFIKL